MEALDTGFYLLKDKVAIVTGGGVGIGKGIAMEMAKAGASVVVAEIDPSRADTAVNEIRAIGGRALKVVADVLEGEQVDNMVRQALQEFGTIDILVNNVGGLLSATGGVPFLEMSEKLWDDMISLNLKPTFLCTKAVAKVMVDQKKKGSIINLSSMSGQAIWTTTGPYGIAPYGVAKAGLINLTATLAVEFGQYNIRVNSIAPAYITTPMSAELHRKDPEKRERQRKRIPLEHFGLPEDIGRVAVFLASDAASYISGQTISVTGGLPYLCEV